MTPSTDVHLELYVRTRLPDPTSARLDAIRSELECLAETRDWTLGVTHWPTKVEHTADAATESVVEHVYSAASAWARQAGVSLDPCFETRRCYSWTSGDPCEMLVLPVACLTITRDGDLQAVYPHRDEDGVQTIPDAIDTLRADEGVATDPERPRTELTP